MVLRRHFLFRPFFLYAPPADAKGRYSPLINLVPLFMKAASQRVVVGINVLNFSTCVTGEMLMPGYVSIVPFRSRSKAYLNNGPLRFQDPKVSIHRRLTQLRIDLSNPIKNLLCGRMGLHFRKGA